MLKTLYTNYNEIVVADCNFSLNQCFFDALSLGCKVYYDVISENERQVVGNTVKKILGDFDISYASQNKIDDFSEIQKIVLNKHTSSNRTKTLLSQIPNAIPVGA